MFFFTFFSTGIYMTPDLKEIKRISRYIIRNHKRFNINLNHQHIQFLNRISDENLTPTAKQINYFIIIKDKITRHIKQQIKAMNEFIRNIKLND